MLAIPGMCFAARSNTHITSTDDSALAAQVTLDM